MSANFFGFGIDLFNTVAGEISTTEAEAFEAIGQYKMVYLNASSLLALADGSNSSKVPALGMVEGAGGILLGQVGIITIKGQIENPAWTWIPGGVLYLSTNGDISQTPPAPIPSHGIQIIGRAISPTKIYIDVGGGLKSVDHSVTHEEGQVDELDGDHLDIDFTPSNYTPNITIAEANNLDQLAAHLKGIDDVFATIVTPARTILVAKVGGHASTIEDGITIANNLVPVLSAANPAGILVYPGVYGEDPLTQPMYLSIKGIGDDEVTCIQANTPTSPLITTPGNNSLGSISLKGASGVGGIAILCSGTSKYHVYNSNISDCEIGMKLSGGITLKLASVDIYNVSKKSIQLTHVDDKLVLHGCQFPLSLIDVGPGFVAGWHYSEDISGDKAFHVFGELSVGSVAQPSEAIFGEGDSHVVGLKVFRNTNLEAGTWTDISSELASFEASQAIVFPGIGAGNCFYIGGDTPFPGIKSNTTIAIVLGAGSIISEYWNGSAWVEVMNMATKANTPFTQYAATPFQRAQSEQVRYGDMTGWATKSLNGEVKYWMRFSIVVAITTSPTLEQTKLHTNRFEANADGTPEFFGSARHLSNINSHLNMTNELQGLAPSNIDIEMSSNLILQVVNNGFKNSSRDGFGQMVVLPGGLDTSFPLRGEVHWAPNSNTSGDVEIEMLHAVRKMGDLVDGSAPEISQKIITTVASNSIDLIKKSSFELRIDTLLPGELISVGIIRDARAGNSNDTFDATIKAIAVRFFGNFWR